MPAAQSLALFAFSSSELLKVFFFLLLLIIQTEVNPFVHNWGSELPVARQGMTNQLPVNVPSHDGIALSSFSRRLQNPPKTNVMMMSVVTWMTHVQTLKFCIYLQ